MSAAATTPHPDAAILAAWGRRSVASAIYNGLAFSNCLDGRYTPEEQIQIDTMDQAEIVICEADAQTPGAVAIQLWTALSHIEQDADADAAVNIMDLDWFLMDETRFDWPTRLILSALRSLRAMGERAAS